MLQSIITEIKKVRQRGWGRWHNNSRRASWKRWIGIAGGILSVFLLALFIFIFSYQDKVYPGVRAAQVSLAGLTEAEAKLKLTTALQRYLATTFPHPVEAEGKTWSLPSPPADLFDIDTAVTQALSVGKQGSWHLRLQDIYQLFLNGETIPLPILSTTDWLEMPIASISATIDVKPVSPTITLAENRDGKAIQIDPGKGGKVVDKDILINRIMKNLSLMNRMEEQIPITYIGQPVTPAQIEATRQRAATLIDKAILLTTPEQMGEGEITWIDEQLISFITFTGNYDSDKIDKALRDNAARIEHKAQDATFVFDTTTQKVKEFTPALEGVELLIPESRDRIINALIALEASSTIPPIEMAITITPPEMTLESVNDLGIKELIGQGTSTYKGSIAGRVFNVNLAASRIQGTLVKPGDVFSFNTAVGEVSAAAGYQKAYIIINGRTELDDGGGVCQVSTTVFRAALHAGLPILERRAHAYRVGYYEQNAKAGLDATVFSPTTDFKFLNDTGHHILVQTTVDSPNRSLTVDIYGTSDGRISEIANHRIWDIVPAPSDIYQDDPTLPLGTIKQVEHKVAGAKAAFDYRVKRNGETIYEKSFYNVFKPWPARYLRGTGPN